MGESEAELVRYTERWRQAVANCAVAWRDAGHLDMARQVAAEARLVLRIVRQLKGEQ